MRRTPLTPIFDNEIRRGGINVGNTPGVTPSVVVPIGLAHQGSTLYQAKGMAVINGVLVVASFYNNRVVTLSLGTSPAVLGFIEDATNLSGPTTVTDAGSNYALVGVTTGGDATTVDVLVTDDPVVADKIDLTGNAPIHTSTVTASTAKLCSATGVVSTVDVTDQEAISETGFDGWDGYTAYAFAYDATNDLLFVADEEYLEVADGDPSTMVDSATLSAGIPIGMFVNPNTGVVAVVIVNSSGDLVVNTFTYTTGGALTTGGTATSSAAALATAPEVGCIVGSGSTIEAFASKTGYTNTQHYQISVATPATPTITSIGEVTGLAQPHTAVSNAGIIYVSDFGDPI